PVRPAPDPVRARPWNAAAPAGYPTRPAPLVQPVSPSSATRKPDRYPLLFGWYESLTGHVVELSHGWPAQIPCPAKAFRTSTKANPAARARPAMTPAMVSAAPSSAWR